MEAFCLFTADPSQPGGAESQMAFLVHFDVTHWRVIVGGVERRLAHADHPEIWPIVAHYPQVL